jgi:hypothetical protein
MNLPRQLLRLQPARHSRESEPVYVVSRSESHSNSKPLFRAPALPTPHQLSRDVPFTVNPRPRLRDRT